MITAASHDGMAEARRRTREEARTLIDGLERLVLPRLESSEDVAFVTTVAKHCPSSVRTALRNHFLQKAFELVSGPPEQRVTLLVREIARHRRSRRSCMERSLSGVQRSLALAHLFKPLDTGVSESNLYDLLDLRSGNPPSKPEC